MEFGRVTNIDEVDYTLPSTHALSEKTFEKLSISQKPHIYIGCPVWADKGYVGKVFPPKTPAKNYLKEYCKQFNTIEVNATHYQIPKEATIQKWKEVATPGFKFCPKFPQIISHRNDFHERDAWVDLFLTAIHGLDEYLGTSFIQFPPNFKPDKFSKLNTFLSKLPKDMSFAVELRNAKWFESESIRKEWYDLFSKYHVTSVITDTSGRRDVLHQILTTNKAFIRFTGNNLHKTDYSRIDEWCSLLPEWIEKGINEVYFFMHEPTKHLCADIATYMIKQLKEKLDVEIKAPRIHTDNTMSLF